jgi:NTP pyrophosphatase (non-canonical NTP hydrolase)
MSKHKDGTHCGHKLGACIYGNVRGKGKPNPGYLGEMAQEIIAINTANGWNCLKPEQWKDTYKVPAILALIHSEASEALEAFRKDDKENFIEELADVVIRVLDCAGGLGVDLDKAIAAKLEKNRHRGFKHGGKRV